MIGIFNDCFPPIMDGVSVTTANYAYWLNHRGEDVCVVTPQAPEAVDNQPYPVYRYLSLPIPMRKPYRFGMPQMDLSFKRRIAATPFSIVHAHCPFSSGDVALGIARSRHIPLIATFHSKYKADFERVVHNKYIVNYLLRSVVNFYEQADEVWIPQAAVEETLREYGYKGPVEVVDNGNDFAGTPYSPAIKAEAMARLGLKKGVPVLLFVGQHIWEKNVGLIIRSLAKMKDVPFKMLFVGTGYAEEEMKHLADSYGLTGINGKIRFEGPVYDREEMRRYYTAADLFLFPSMYDNAPLVVREAAAMHTPAVLLKGSTASEVVKDGFNGFLSDDGDEAYAATLRRLLANPMLVANTGLCASTTLARSWEDIAGEVLDRYNHLIYRKKHEVV